MEDLRDEKTKNKEEGVVKEISRWDIINAVVNKINYKINFYIKKIKSREFALHYYLLMGLFIFLIATYPLEIGTFIGDWVFYFWSGITKNFK